MPVEAPTVHEIVQRSRWLRSFAQARVAAAITIFGEGMFAILDRATDRPTYLIRMRIAHVVFATGVLVFLQVRRRKLSLEAVIASTLVILLPLFPIFWLTENEAVYAGRPWGPFIGHRFVIVGAAMLVPGPLWVPAIVVAVFTASALLHYLFLAGSIAGLGEPWIIALHAVFAVAILSLRAELEKLRERLARARSAVHSLNELARAARFVKDGTASPLQTILAATMLIRRDPADPDELLDRIDRAAERVEGLVTTLDQYEPSGEIESESFDAQTELQRQRRDLIRRARSLSTSGAQPAPVEETGAQR